MSHSDISGCCRLLPDKLHIPSLLDIYFFPVRAFRDFYIFFPVRFTPSPNVSNFMFGHFVICPPSSRFGFPVFFSTCFLLHQFPSISVFHIRKYPDVWKYPGVAVFFPIRFFFHISGCFLLPDILGCSRLVLDSFHVPSLPDIPSLPEPCRDFPSFMLARNFQSFMFRHSYFIISGCFRLPPILACRDEFDPGLLSLETETRQCVLLGISSSFRNFIISGLFRRPSVFYAQVMSGNFRHFRKFPHSYFIIISSFPDYSIACLSFMFRHFRKLLHSYFIIKSSFPDYSAVFQSFLFRHFRKFRHSYFIIS